MMDVLAMHMLTMHMLTMHMLTMHICAMTVQKGSIFVTLVHLQASYIHCMCVTKVRGFPRASPYLCPT